MESSLTANVDHRSQDHEDLAPPNERGNDSVALQDMSSRATSSTSGVSQFSALPQSRRRGAGGLGADNASQLSRAFPRVPSTEPSARHSASGLAPMPSISEEPESSVRTVRPLPPIPQTPTASTSGGQRAFPLMPKKAPSTQHSASGLSPMPSISEEPERSVRTVRPLPPTPQPSTASTSGTPLTRPLPPPPLSSQARSRLLGARPMPQTTHASTSTLASSSRTNARTDLRTNARTDIDSEPRTVASSSRVAFVPPLVEEEAPAARQRDNGERLEGIVPQISKPAKGLRRLGRMIRSDNENTLFRITNKTKPANGVVAGLVAAHVPSVQTAYVATGAHETVNTVLGAHASATAYSRQSRYRNKLKDSAQDAELRRIPVTDGLYLAQVAGRTDAESRQHLVNKIATHDPEAANADTVNHDKMRDVLVSRYIADVQGGKRLGVNVKRTALSLTGMGAAAALTAGTHGIAPAAIAGGAVLSGQNILDNRTTAVGIKQYYRDKKETRIKDIATQGILSSNEPPTAQRWSEQVAAATHTVNQQRISRFIPMRFGSINANKSTARKSEEVSIVKKRATELVMGTIKETDQTRLKEIYTDPKSAATTNQRSLRHFYHEAIGENPDIRNACQLMRDLGMSKTEAQAHLRTAVGTHLAQTSKAAGKVADIDFAHHAQPAMRTMDGAPDAGLESVIGSAMARR